MILCQIWIPLCPMAGPSMHKPVFFLTKVGEEWSTHCGKHTFPNAIVYPNIVSSIPGDVFDSGEDVWVCATIDKANKLGFCRIDVLCGAIIPTKRVEHNGGSTQDLFRCHPSFHSYPYLQRSWHDWAMIRWVPHVIPDMASENDIVASSYTVAARLLLFAKLSNNVDTEIRSKVVAVIQSLSNNSPKPDSLLTFALGDTIDRAPKVIDATTISSTAFVLPCVSSPSNDFPVDIDKATYFLVMPPQVEWKDFGWDT
jgi:hypothetical protein